MEGRTARPFAYCTYLRIYQMGERFEKPQLVMPATKATDQGRSKNEQHEVGPDSNDQPSGLESDALLLPYNLTSMLFFFFFF